MPYGALSHHLDFFFFVPVAWRWIYSKWYTRQVHLCQVVFSKNDQNNNSSPPPSSRAWPLPHQEIRVYLALFETAQDFGAPSKVEMTLSTFQDYAIKGHSSFLLALPHKYPSGPSLYAVRLKKNQSKTETSPLPSAPSELPASHQHQLVSHVSEAFWIRIHPNGD